MVHFAAYIVIVCVFAGVGATGAPGAGGGVTIEFSTDGDIAIVPEIAMSFGVVSAAFFLN